MQKEKARKSFDLEAPWDKKDLVDNKDDQRLVGEGGGRDPWTSWGNKLPSSGNRILLQQGVKASFKFNIKDLKHF